VEPAKGIRREKMKRWNPVLLAFYLFVILCTLYWGPLAGPLLGQPKRVTNSMGMAFVLIQPGTFLMGSPKDEPHRNRDEMQYKVTISRPFYLQTTEVTQGQWKAIMKKNPSRFKKCGENCPVEKVSWYDSQRFIKKLNALGEGTYRLPTEAEWEYAARAGTTTAYSWGDTADCKKALFENSIIKGDDRCLSYVRSKGLKTNSTAPVKSFPPNPWGLYDMSGNVWEWCQDWYGPYPKAHVVDPKGPTDEVKKARRGGSWFKKGYNCRSANRYMAHPANRYYYLGFRLVRNLD
jgi:formylglycine-generating enzyme required for sulfatase activity